MQHATCAHHEKITILPKGKSRGTCKICGQIVEYDSEDIKEQSKIIKLGRVDGAVVLPNDRITVDLPTQEMTELANARESAPAPAPAAKEPATKTTRAGCSMRSRPTFEKLLRHCEENKEEILRDHQDLKLLDFFKKWGLRSVSWTKIKALWKVPRKPSWKRGGTIAKAAASEKPAVKEKSPEPPGPQTGPPTLVDLIRALQKMGLALPHNLPPFPEFDKSWPFLVQEKWLEVYLDLSKTEAEGPNDRH